jgi:hypothetical protein
VQLPLHLKEEGLQLFSLLNQRSFLAHQRHQLGLEVGIKASDHLFHGVANFSHPLVFGSSNRLNVPFLVISLFEFPALKLCPERGFFNIFFL